MRSAAFLAGLLAAGLWQALPARADPSLETAIKAAYLVKFVPFIDWPQNAFVSAVSPLTICVLGDDPFGANLDKAVAGQQQDGHALAVQRMANFDPSTSCQILFIASDYELTPDEAAVLRGRPVVTVTDSGMRSGGIIRFIVVNDHVRFDIDEAAAQDAGVQINSKLLSLAHAVRQNGGRP